MLGSIPLRRSHMLFVAFVFAFASIMPALISQKVNAYTLMGPRQVRMSTSQVSVLNATYKVKFQVTSDTTDLGGIVVAFCQTTPIIEDTTCTNPTDFDLTGATVGNQSNGTADEGDATVDITSLTTVQLEDEDGTAATELNTLTLSNATAIANASIDAGDYVTFEINNVDNPSTTGTFYARIYTYATQADAQGYTLANPEAVGTIVDAGGIALSTAQQITVTSKVQERLTFCVYTGALVQANCTVTGNQVTLGDANGVLDPTIDYTNIETKYNITTNAAGGAVVRLKGDILRTGSNSIDAIAAGNNTGTTSTPGTEQFGVCTYEDAGGLTTGGITPAAPYASGLCSGVTTGGNADNGATFAFDTTTANDNITSTYGDTIASKTAGNYNTGRVAFLGNISNTTEAGIYTTTMTFVATGTY